MVFAKRTIRFRYHSAIKMTLLLLGRFRQFKPLWVPSKHRKPTETGQLDVRLSKARFSSPEAGQHCRLLHRRLLPLPWLP